jgi:hypothetical protein
MGAPFVEVLPKMPGYAAIVCPASREFGFLAVASDAELLTYRGFRQFRSLRSF